MAAPAKAGGKRAALPAAFIVRVGDIADTETICALIIVFSRFQSGLRPAAWSADCALEVVEGQEWI